MLPLVQRLPAMWSKRLLCRSTVAETVWFSAWVQQRSSSNAILKPCDVVSSRLLNCSALPLRIPHSMALVSMLNTLHKRLTHSSVRWNRNGGLTDMLWLQVPCSSLTKRTHLLAVVQHNLKSALYATPSVPVQTVWLLPIPKDSLDTQWVLASKMQACSTV